MNCSMKLGVDVGWVKAEWHGHDLDGAVQLVADSRTICIRVYPLVVRLR